MAKDLNPPNLFNPMMLWTDLGLHALETTLSSSQHIGDGLDRLTRAGASPEANEPAGASRAAGGDRSALAASSGLALAAQMQRATFELMTQAWQQWMNTLGTLASLGAGRSFGETVARQNPWLSAMREGLQSRGTDETVFTRAPPGTSSRQQGSRQRESHAEETEHGFATAEPKRRSRGSRAKSKSRARSN